MINVSHLQKYKKLTHIIPPSWPITETPKDFVIYLSLNSFTVHFFTLINAYFHCNKSFGEKRLKKKTGKKSLETQTAKRSL